MKIIFLDFDGVLNSQLYFRSLSAKNVRENNDPIDPIAVGMVNKIIYDTGARVVVTSTWRLSKTVEQLQGILESRGFNGEVIGKTPDLREGEFGDCIFRGNEIHHWMRRNNDLPGNFPYSSNYVILDDDSDFLYWHKDNLILCDSYVGITPGAIHRARMILRGEA